MNISKRQATIAVLSFQLTAIIILWLNQFLTSKATDPLTLGTSLAVVIYGGMLFAYLRGWEYARHASVVLITVIVATFLPEPFVSTYAPFLILLGPVLALVLLNPYWVIGSAVATLVILVIRAGGAGVYVNLTTLLMFAMLIAGLFVSRVIAETAYGQVKKAEEALNDSQARMAGIINSAMDAIISINNSQRIVLFNPAAEKMFGYTSDDVMGKPLDMLLPNLHRAKHSKQIEEFERTGITNRHMNGYMEITGMKKNGDEFPIDTSISQVQIKDGKLFTAILRDVTEHKLREKTLQKMHDELELQFERRTAALSQTNALLETMLEYVPDQIYFKDAKSRFIKNSRSQAKALGLNDPSLVVGKTDFDFFPHAQRSFDEEQEIIRSGKPLVDFEERVIWPDGEETWVSTSKVPLRNHNDEIIGTFGISRDITDRKRAEEALRKAKEELEIRVADRTTELSETNQKLQLELIERKQVENALRENKKLLEQTQSIAGLGTYFIDLTTGTWKGSAIFDNLLGIDEKFERTMETWPDLIHFNDRQMMTDYFTNEVIGKHTRFDREYRIIRQNDQVERWVRTLGELEFDSQNQPVKMVGTVQDITESKHIKSQMEYQARLLKEITDAVIAADDQYNITIWNHGAELLYGWSADEAIGHKTTEIIRSDMTSAERDEILKQLYENGEYHIELIQYRKDGQPIFVDASTVTIYNTNDQVTGILSVNRDITDRKRADDALITSEARFRNTLDAMLEGCQILGFDWRYLYLNDVADKHNRRPKEELLGQKYMDMWPGIESTEVFAVIKRCLEERDAQSMQNRFEFPDGLYGWFELRIYPVPEGVVILSIDITERKRAEDEIRHLNESLEQRIVERTAELSDLYNNAPCGYHSLNVDGLMVRVNDTELNWLGYKRDELVGKVNIMNLLTSDSVEVFKRNFPVFQETGLLYNLELEMIRKDGSILPILLSATVVRNQAGEYVESRTTLIDYTDRKRIEDEILKSKIRLEATNKELEAFSYSVSHDLRSPLRGIDGWSMALLEDYGHILDENGLSHIQRVRAETQRMGTLIDDILQLSRITRADMNREKVDMSAIAETVSARLQETTPPDRHVEFTIQPGLACMGDPKLMDVVLTNLLGNAYKFTGKKQEAHIEFGQTIVEGEKAFFIRDNGAGFDMTHANNLFGAFQRMHRTSEFPGTGVGLATVQRIINRHGGSIWASSEVEQGAIFYFTVEDKTK